MFDQATGIIYVKRGVKGTTKENRHETGEKSEDLEKKTPIKSRMKYEKENQ